MIHTWTVGLLPSQSKALDNAAKQWTGQVGIALAPARSAADAQLVISEVPTLEALPALGEGAVEYAHVTAQERGGYYDHADMQVAMVPGLGYDDWLDAFLHELGHVSGLDHVAASDEVMRPLVGLPQSTYGPGDVTGLQSERPR